MEKRYRFYKEFPEYSHVFFEALLIAPPEIAKEIVMIIQLWRISLGFLNKKSIMDTLLILMMNLSKPSNNGYTITIQKE